MALLLWTFLRIFPLAERAAHLLQCACPTLFCRMLLTAGFPGLSALTRQSRRIFFCRAACGPGGIEWDGRGAALLVEPAREIAPVVDRLTANVERGQQLPLLFQPP